MYTSIIPRNVLRMGSKREQISGPDHIRRLLNHENNYNDDDDSSRQTSAYTHVLQRAAVWYPMSVALSVDVVKHSRINNVKTTDIRHQ
ncbi:hypothetical protein WG66_012488 [Moniliophthora roreri]|nr:hypothetical protein WG66_012488 [Moniliophthora roreri]